MKEDLIVKESISDDIKSVEKLDYRRHAFYLKEKKVDFREIEEHWGINFIIQKLLKQYPMLATPHKHSVTTFRMVTLRWNNQVNYLMTYARFGANGEIKDNGREGRIVVGVSREGKFSDSGMGDDAKIYKSHPTTGFNFSDFEDVPNFDEYIEYVKKLHNQILHYNYVSWDIAMGVDGKPIFIEMNFRGPIWKYQMVTEKPIFGEFTESILVKAVREREKREKLMEEQRRKQEKRKRRMNEKNRELQELVNETLTTTEEYVENAIPLVEKLGGDFYSAPSKENWDELINLFDGLTWIIETLREIDSIKELESMVNEYAMWNEYVQSVAALNRVVPELKKALEDKDNPLIADLLSHAVTPTFKDMFTNLRELKR